MSRRATCSRRCGANDPLIEVTRQIADRLIGLSAIIGSIALIAEVVVIMTDVIGRAMGAPLFGSQDLVTMIMVFVVFGGMAICDRVGGHIAIDLFERHFPAGLNRAINIVTAALGALIFLAIAWTVYASAKLSLMLHLSTNLLNLPKAWFQWALCGFALVAAFAMALRALELALTRRDIRSEISK